MVYNHSDSMKPFKLNLVPYAAEASQEFSRGKAQSGKVDNWCNVWANCRADKLDSVTIGNWTNTWWNCRVDQPGLPGDRVEIGGFKKSQPLLQDVMRLRKDDKSFGFVQNVHGAVFYADVATINTLQSLAETPLSHLKANHPEVLKALQI